MHTAEETLSIDRLCELAVRAERTGRDVFSPFLTPPESELAKRAAKAANVSVTLSGGYEDAERIMARFGDEQAAFPYCALEITWPHSDAPSHRDLLGSVMALGLKRNRIGDIVLNEDRAYLFCESTASELVLTGFTQANRSPVHVRRLSELPALAPPEGREIKDTVLSLRLDAVLSGAFQLSRGKAAELIRSGLVKLKHVPTISPDARVAEGDAISVRGMGRAKLESVGAPTKKGRLPIIIKRFGD